MHSLLIVLLPATLLSPVKSQGFEGFDGFGQGPKFCPPYRCQYDNEEPIAKWPLKLESTGCSGMGGMQIFSPGSGSTTDRSAQDNCCDLRHACLQTCGAVKTFCDDEFLKCGKAACEAIADEEGRKQCNSSAQINELMVKMDNCQRYDQGQYSHCECVPKSEVPARRERVLRAFYKKYNPDGVDKVEALATKADTPARMVGLLMKLYKKYPSVIKKIKDPQQEYMDRIMKEAREKAPIADEEVDASEEEESDAEDLGTVEL